MGCGGSRADAIEPRYYESWTRETESTWLTNTDSEGPPQEAGGEAGGREQGGPRPGLLEDGKSAQTGVTTASATASTLNSEKRNNCAPPSMNPMVHVTGAMTQRQKSLRAPESKWDSQKISTKEVTINVTKGIRQSDRRKTKNCVN
ncbi:brain and acute leukemia cytoplasmic protein [Colius striatus]|uniref:brain and acute leukemia cytoplasmic protein n=1 Tax=Colius striatus TaxID=57412 RepID=UPI002B1CE658|nr:brain and acute leukemia cytoplasmic protein [Colius striatus]